MNTFQVLADLDKKICEQQAEIDAVGTVNDFVDVISTLKNYGLYDEGKRPSFIDIFKKADKLDPDERIFFLESIACDLSKVYESFWRENMAA